MPRQLRAESACVQNILPLLDLRVWSAEDHVTDGHFHGTLDVLNDAWEVVFLDMLWTTPRLATGEHDD